MTTNKKINTVAKLFVIALPLILLFVCITAYQIYTNGNPSQDPAPIAQQLQQVGGYSNTTEPSLTLTNVGNSQITIRLVVYDGSPLTQGVVGGSAPAFQGGDNSSFCEVNPNTLIFPKANHWNMDTGGLCSPTILPDGDATLYLGVYSNTQSSHILLVFTNVWNYSFFL